MTFIRETTYFLKILDDLLAKKHGGKFALIYGESLVGTFTTFDEAYGEGVRKFGDKEFLVKQIIKNPPPENFPSLMFVS